MELKADFCLTKDMDMPLEPATICGPLFLHEYAIAYDSKLPLLRNCNMIQSTYQQEHWAVFPQDQEQIGCNCHHIRIQQRCLENECLLVKMIMLIQSGIHHIITFYILPIAKFN